jgi:hypothetical protein
MELVTDYVRMLHSNLNNCYQIRTYWNTAALNGSEITVFQPVLQSRSLPKYLRSLHIQ